MSEIGGGSGTSYPATLDTDNSQEINTPNPGRTKARAEVVNDLASAVVAIETELGTDPAGTKTDVKTYLQTEHNTDATHKVSLVAMLAGAQTFTGSKTFSATMKLSKGADVASGSALALGSDGNYFDITGTTTITSIQTVAVGTVVILHFDDALTLTHHATDLILPGGTNITTTAGDEYMFVEYATGDWRLISGSRVTTYAAGSVGTTALADNAVTTAKIDDGDVTQAKLVNFAAGSYYLAKADTERSTTNPAATKVKEIIVPRAGTYTVYFELHSASPGEFVQAQIYKNSSAFGTQRSTSSGTYVNYSENLVFAIGDLVQLYYWITTGTVFVQNFRISVSQPNIASVVTD